MPEWTLLSALLVFAIVALAAFTQGFGGFGIGLVAVSLLGLISPEPAAMVFVVTCFAGASILTTLALGLRDAAAKAGVGRVGPGGMSLGDAVQRGVRNLDLIAIGALLLGVIPGFFLGHFVVCDYGTTAWFAAGLGACLLAMAAVGLIKPQPRGGLAVASGPAWGLGGGVLMGAVASGGPPLVIFLRGRGSDPRAMKPALQLIFIGGVFTRVALAETVPMDFDPAALAWILSSIVVAIGASVLGHAASNRVSARTFTIVVFTMIGIAGLVHLLRGVAAA